MDNLNYAKDFKDEQWISLSEPVMAEPVSLDNLEIPEDIEPDKSEPKKKKSIKAPIVTIQLIVFLAVLLFLFLSKTFLPDIFDTFKATYDREIKSTMFSNGDFKSNSYLSFFTSSSDEA